MRQPLGQGLHLSRALCACVFARTRARTRRRPYRPELSLKSAAIAAFLGIVCAVGVAGCGAVSQPSVAGGGAAATTTVASAPHHGGTATIAIVDEPPILNRHLAVSGVQSLWLINKALFSPWVDFAPGLKPIPVLATSVPTLQNGGVRMTKAGGMQVRFAIKRIARWSDGVPITCSDMRFTWKTMMDPRWQIGSTSGWSDITGVQCPSPRHVVINFRRPLTTYIDDILFPGPLPRHALIGKDFDTVWNETITVDSGPFVVQHWHHGIELDLSRNPNYWNAGPTHKPYLDHLVFRFLDNENTAAIQVASGEVDVYNQPLTSSIGDWKAALPLDNVVHQPATQFEQLGFQTARPPLNDARVRQAIAYSMNRQEIVNDMFGSGIPVLQSTLMPGQQYAQPAWQRYTQNYAKADALLEHAGYRLSGDQWMRNGKPLTLTLTTPDAMGRSIAQIIQEQLAANHINVQISYQQTSVFFSTTQSSGLWDMAIWSLNVFADPGQSYYFDCARYGPDAAGDHVNYWRWCGANDMAMVRATATTLDPAKRRTAFTKLQNAMANEVPLIPLFEREDTVASSKRIHGLRENSRGALTWNVDSWWVTP